MTIEKKTKRDTKETKNGLPLVAFDSCQQDNDMGLDASSYKMYTIK